MKFITLFVAFVFIFSCGGGTDDIPEEVKLKYQKADEHAAAVSVDIVKANNSLAFKLFKAVSAADLGKNIMISPLSVSIAMAMTLNGAAGENLDEMKSVLGFGTKEKQEINSQFYELIQSLSEADVDVVLSIADSVWMDKQFEPDVKDTFLNPLKESYLAEPFTIDFKAENAANLINNWVSEKTEGKIEKILEEIGSDAVMYLINAIYFKAAWELAFDKDNSFDGTFTTSDGKEKKVKMMTFKDNQELEFYTSGYEDNGYNVVKLPYGRGKFSFYGIIPVNYDKKIDNFIAELDENSAEKFFTGLTKQEIPVILPSFKFAYEKSLVDIFISLGMTKAFSSGGFTDMAENGEELYISDIKHKTFIEVNEEGTEAAAVTSVEVGKSAIMEGFTGTRPFVFIIRDDRSGTILFTGKIEDPSN